MDTRPRDSQRKALYDWERRLPGWPGPKLSLFGCQQLVDRVWREWSQLPSPVVRDGRGRRHACYAPCEHEIRLPRWSRREMIVLHELAHGLLREREDLAWHGPEFATAYLGLLARHAGIDASIARVSAERQRPRRVRFDPRTG